MHAVTGNGTRLPVQWQRRASLARSRRRDRAIPFPSRSRPPVFVLGQRQRRRRERRLRRRRWTRVSTASRSLMPALLCPASGGARRLECPRGSLSHGSGVWVFKTSGLSVERWLPLAAGGAWWVALYPGLVRRRLADHARTGAQRQRGVWFTAWWIYVIDALQPRHARDSAAHVVRRAAADVARHRMGRPRHCPGRGPRVVRNPDLCNTARRRARHPGASRRVDDRGPPVLHRRHHSHAATQSSGSATTTCTWCWPRC